MNNHAKLEIKSKVVLNKIITDTAAISVLRTGKGDFDRFFATGGDAA